nr:50S ribosomal protein L3 [Candidatus Levybacteria bacterium]
MQLNSLVGKKIYQKQGFLQDGTRVPLTGVEVLGNMISQIKTESKEGYNALQLGIGIKKKAAKREMGHSKKAGLEKTPRFLKEIRVNDLEGAVLGSQVSVSEIFQPGDMVDVTGTSKGKGFAGGVKRHGFHGGPKTHGQSDRHRAPGSIGQGTTPGRVYKGKRMAGRMGSDTVTLKNLEIIEITADGVLLIKGLVPGSINSIVVVKKIGENKKFIPLYKEAVEEQLEEKSAGQPSVSDDVQQIKGDSRSSIPDDARPTSESEANEPTASLSDSQSIKSAQSQEISTDLSVDSSEDGQAPIAQESDEDKENKKLSEAKSASGGKSKEEVKDAS